MSIVNIGLDQTCTVYTPSVSTGEYTVVATSGLSCRLALIGTTGDMGPSRTEIPGARRLMWGPDYLMPETAQVEIDGERWNIQAGTLAAPRDLSGSVVYRRAEVTKAVS
jgi:hypothetical protein